MKERVVIAWRATLPQMPVELGYSWGGMNHWVAKLGELFALAFACAAIVPACDSSAGGGDGDEASVGDAGNCRADPDATPELVANADLDADVIARAAAVIGSCMPDDGVDRNATHLWNANIAERRPYFANVAQAHCLAAANCGCQAIPHCLGYEVEVGPDIICSPGCAGDVSSICLESDDGELALALHADCSKIGLSCHEVLHCSDYDAMACNVADEPQCRDGQRPLYCENDMQREGPDCEALGLGCFEGKCQGTGATCTDESFGGEEEVVPYDGVSCTGGTLEACVSGRLASLECSLQGPGFDCQLVDGTPFCGLASDCLPASDYGPSPTGPSCDGTLLTFCNAGRLETIDCESLGFTGCSIDSSMDVYGCTPTGPSALLP